MPAVSTPAHTHTHTHIHTHTHTLKSFHAHDVRNTKEKKPSWHNLTESTCNPAALCQFSAAYVILQCYTHSHIYSSLLGKHTKILPPRLYPTVWPPHYKAMWHHLCCGDTLKIFFLVTVTHCIYKHLVIRVENDLSKCLKIIFKLYLHLFGKAADSIDYWVINVFKNKVLSQTLLPYLILYIIFKYWWITNNTISFFCIYNSQLESFS